MALPYDRSSQSSQTLPRAARPGLWLAALLTLLLPALLAGCGSSSSRSTLPTNPPSSTPPTAGQKGTVTMTPQYIALAPGQTYQFQASTTTPGSSFAWYVNGIQGGNATDGTISTTGVYTAPTSLSVSGNVTVTAALAGSGAQNYATSAVALLQPAAVNCPNVVGNPQVAQYAMYLPAPGTLTVHFGQSTNYDKATWAVPAPTPNGGNTSVYVAGMLASSTYHMQAQIQFQNGATFTDVDHTCNTGALPSPMATVQLQPINGTPAPGIQLWNTILPYNMTDAFATDINGNVIWTYSFKNGSGIDLIQGIHPLPNGDFLTLVSYLSSVTSNIPNGTIDEVREIDLAGNTVKSINMTELNQKLASSNLRDASGNLYQLGSFHHDVLALPNGHWVLLASEIKNFPSLSGYTSPVNVIGDAIVDVDQNLNPDWVWNTFDHLDINRRPMNFPDWTHSNAMLYSADDHNLLLSIRHQNWIIKINFLDGTGSGDILWHLGEGGDFKLENGVDPTDWFYGQHGMNFFTPNTTGDFEIGLMDNGIDRQFPTGSVFCTPNKPASAQCYSTLSVLELNEANMTATLRTHYDPGPTFYSYFGGDAQLLSNNDMQVDFCAKVGGATIQELDPTATQVIWNATTPNSAQYRVLREPSLYPGVQW